MPISLENITIPDPEPYDSKDERRQQENYYFIMNQILAEAKAQGATWEDLNSSGTMSLSSEALEELLHDLVYQERVIDFGPYRISLLSKVQEEG